jgi:hypothetical protein
LRQCTWRLDVEIVAAPDVERRLLKQKREAYGHQHLPQHIRFDCDGRYPLQQQ